MEITNKEREENNEFKYYTKQGIPVEELNYMIDRHDRYRPSAEIDPKTKNEIIKMHKEEKKRIREKVLKGEEAIAATNTRGFGLPSPKKKSRKKRTDELVGEWRPFYIPSNIPKEPQADLQFTYEEFKNYPVQNPEVKNIIKSMHSKKKTLVGKPIHKFKLKKGKLQKPVKGGKRRKKKTRKKRGGHHLYKRLGVSKYASQKQIKNLYTKLKKKNKATRKVKEAYKILSNKKTRKQYNNRYKKFVKTKKR